MLKHGLLAPTILLEEEGCVPSNKSTSGGPYWNCLGTKPKSKS